MASALEQALGLGGGEGAPDESALLALLAQMAGQSPGAFSGMRRSVVDPVTGEAVAVNPPEDPEAIVKRGNVLPVGFTKDGRPKLAAPAPIKAAGDLAVHLADEATNVPNKLAGLGRYVKRVADGEQIVDPQTGEYTDDLVNFLKKGATSVQGPGLFGGAGAGGHVLGAGMVPKQAFRDGRVDLGYVMREVEPGAMNGLGRDLNRLRSKMTEGGQFSEADLPVRNLVATQRSVNPDYAARLSKSSGDAMDLPAVYKVNGRHILADGHHRATAASETADTVRARLYDMDAARSAPKDDGQLELLLQALGNLGMGAPSRK